MVGSQPVLGFRSDPIVALPYRTSSTAIHQPVYNNPMPEYRRNFVPGGTYFFTLVTFNRRPLFSNKTNCQLLVDIWKDVESRRPFESVAACILPDHIHAIWTLPDGDIDYPIRWKEIKRLFTQEYHRQVHTGLTRTLSQQIQGEAIVSPSVLLRGASRAQTVLGTHDSKSRGYERAHRLCPYQPVEAWTGV